MNRKLPIGILAACLWMPVAHAQEHDHAMHMQHQANSKASPATGAASPVAAAPPADSRVVVRFPATLREHTLANMRDHLLALQEIQSALARQDYDKAGDIAERRLGMSSLALHGAHEVAKYMPAGMQTAGTAMHRAASRLAVASKDAGATGDLKPVFDAMSGVTAQCVACHAGYRVK